MRGSLQGPPLPSYLAEYEIITYIWKNHITNNNIPNMEYIELSRLTENEVNPRYITEDDMAKLQLSIATFPAMLFKLRPIVVDETLNVIGGNMRLLALQRIAAMSDGELRSLISKREDKTEGERDALMEFWGDWRKNPQAPIVNADDLTDEQKDEFMAKDNINNGSWDSAKLAARWDMKTLDSWGIAKWAISHDDRIKAKEDYGEAEDDGYTPDEAESAESSTKLGDVFQLGNHRLICGDSAKAEYVNAVCDGAKMDLLLTDPPYGVTYKGTAAKERESIKSDALGEEEFCDFLSSTIGNGVSNLRGGGSYYIWYSEKRGYEFEVTIHNLKELSPRISLVWVKNNIVLQRESYQSKYEKCFYGVKKGDTPPYFIPRRDISNVLEVKKPQESQLHPAMKPIELFGQLIQNSSREGENVLDIFGGSGTTLIACEQLNRKCYMCEYEPRYVDVIIKRWEDFTGRKAIKLHNINERE